MVLRTSKEVAEKEYPHLGYGSREKHVAVSDTHLQGVPSYPRLSSFNHIPLSTLPSPLSLSMASKAAQKRVCTVSWYCYQSVILTRNTHSSSKVIEAKPVSGSSVWIGRLGIRARAFLGLHFKLVYRRQQWLLVFASSLVYN